MQLNKSWVTVAVWMAVTGVIVAAPVASPEDPAPAPAVEANSLDQSLISNNDNSVISGEHEAQPDNFGSVGSISSIGSSVPGRARANDDIDALKRVQDLNQLKYEIEATNAEAAKVTESDPRGQLKNAIISDARDEELADATKQLEALQGTEDATSPALHQAQTRVEIAQQAVNDAKSWNKNVDLTASSGKLEENAKTYVDLVERKKALAAQKTLEPAEQNELNEISDRLDRLHMEMGDWNAQQDLGAEMLQKVFGKWNPKTKKFASDPSGEATGKWIDWMTTAQKNDEAILKLHDARVLTEDGWWTSMFQSVKRRLNNWFGWSLEDIAAETKKAYADVGKAKIQLSDDIPDNLSSVAGADDKSDDSSVHDPQPEPKKGGEGEGEGEGEQPAGLNEKEASVMQPDPSEKEASVADDSSEIVMHGLDESHASENVGDKSAETVPEENDVQNAVSKLEALGQKWKETKPIPGVEYPPAAERTEAVDLVENALKADKSNQGADSWNALQKLARENPNLRDLIQVGKDRVQAVQSIGKLNNVAELWGKHPDLISPSSITGVETTIARAKQGEDLGAKGIKDELKAIAEKSPYLKYYINKKYPNLVPFTADDKAAVERLLPNDVTSLENELVNTAHFSESSKATRLPNLIERAKWIDELTGHNTARKALVSYAQNHQALLDKINTAIPEHADVAPEVPGLDSNEQKFSVPEDIPSNPEIGSASDIKVPSSADVKAPEVEPVADVKAPTTAEKVAQLDDKLQQLATFKNNPNVKFQRYTTEDNKAIHGLVDDVLKLQDPSVPALTDEAIKKKLAATVVGDTPLENAVKDRINNFRSYITALRKQPAPKKVAQLDDLMNQVSAYKGRGKRLSYDDNLKVQQLVDDAMKLENPAVPALEHDAILKKIATTVTGDVALEVAAKDKVKGLKPYVSSLKNEAQEAQHAAGRAKKAAAAAAANPPASGDQDLLNSIVGNGPSSASNQQAADLLNNIGDIDQSQFDNAKKALKANQASAEVDSLLQSIKGNVDAINSGSGNTADLQQQLEANMKQAQAVEEAGDKTVVDKLATLATKMNSDVLKTAITTTFGEQAGEQALTQAAKSLSSGEESLGNELLEKLFH